MDFLIATHSYMAAGLCSAAEHLQGKRENVAVINAYTESDNFEQELDTYMKTVKSQNIIVLTDLLGGSVNQSLMKYKGDKILHIIAGVNLTAVLKVLSIDDDVNLVTQLRSCVEQSREQMIFENKLPE